MADTLGKTLITGASGNTGAEILKLFKAAGLPVWTADRKPSGPGSRKFDFMDPAAFTPAFSGIEKVFLVRPPAISDVKKYMFPAINAADKAGVKHIVLLSLQGADKNPVVPHRKLELYLMKQKMAWTFLRPSFFMQNLSTTHREEIKERNEIFVPAGKGKTNFIDVRDLALAAFKTLTEPGHENKAYELTGTQSLTYYEIADILTAVLKRKITYKSPTALQFFIRKLKEKQPIGYALITSILYSVSALGMAAGTTDEFYKLTGKQPIEFRQFAEDFKAVWQ